MAVSLQIGFPEKVVSAATGVGLTASKQFALPNQQAEKRQLTLQYVPTGAVTAFKVDVQISLNGGVTFQTLAAAQDLFAAPLVLANVVSGALYQLNVQTMTGGTSVDVWACFG